MNMSSASYRGRAMPRKYLRRLPAGASLALVLLLSGCAGAGLPFGEFDRSGTQRAALGSVQLTKASLPGDEVVEPSDWEAIRRIIARLPTENSSIAGWSNPVTGSSGEIVVLPVEASKLATKCRAFATTITDIRGIRRYRGQACQPPAGTWQLSDMAPDDTQLL